MSSGTDLKCWEVTNCNNIDCLTRKEPETPCWQIAERMGDYRDISNTCTDCVVHMLKNGTPAESRKNLGKILKSRVLSNRTNGNHPVCPLKKITAAI